MGTAAVYSTRFLSTPSARRATQIHRCKLDAFDISIHALREEGDCSQRSYLAILYISIHALREEGDWLHRRRPENRQYFYPRPPRGGRRVAYTLQMRSGCISIHALREEGDQATGYVYSCPVYF